MIMLKNCTSFSEGRHLSTKDPVGLTARVVTYSETIYLVKRASFSYGKSHQVAKPILIWAFDNVDAT